MERRQDAGTNSLKKKHKRVIALLSLGTLLCAYGNLSPDSECLLGVRMEMHPKRLWFMTNISLLVSTITLFLGVTNRIYSMWYKRREKSYLSSLHTSLLSFILYFEIFISLSFWPLFFCHPNWVLTKRSLEGKNSVRIFNNLCMHFFPSIFLFVDYITTSSLCRKSYALYVYTALMCMVQILYKYTYGRWRYRVLNGISTMTIISIPFIILISVLIIEKICIHSKKSILHRNILHEYMLYTDSLDKPTTFTE